MIKLIFKSFWEMTIVNGQSFLSDDSDEKFKKAIRLVHVFYLIVFVFSVQTFSSFSQFPEWDLLLKSEHLFQPIWSVKWISSFKWESVIRGILLFYFVSSVLGILFFQRSVVVRILVFLSLFVYVSLISSFGKIDHFMHFMIVASFLLIFLPSKKDKTYKINTLKVFFSVQIFIFLGYFSSGAFKILGTIKQLAAGSFSVFSDQSLAINLSKTMMAFDLDYFYTDYLLNQFSHFFSALLIVGYLVELLAVYLIFKINLHRIWGFILLMLHAIILLTVGADFTPQIIVVGIFIFFSPFSKSNGDLWNDFRFLYQSIKRLFFRRNFTEIVIYYDGNCITCNEFLMKLAKHKLPESLYITPQESEGFLALKEASSDLINIDSIVVVYKTKNEEFIKIKADAISSLFSVINRFSVQRLFYNLSPFVGNLVYDIKAKNRKRSNPNFCLVPPETLVKKIRRQH